MWCISAAIRAAVSFSAGLASLREASAMAFRSVACIRTIVAYAQPFQKNNSCSCDPYHSPAAPQRRVRGSGLGLAVEVVDAALAADHHVALRVAGPDPHLVAVGIDGGGGNDDGGEHQDPDRLLGLVADAVGAGRTLLEEDDVPGLEPIGPLRMAQGRVALQDQQPLLLPHLVVVGADRLPGRQLVDGDAGFLWPPEELAEASLAAAKARRVLVVVAELRRRDVDPPHAPKLAAQTAPFGTPTAAEARINVRPMPTDYAQLDRDHVWHPFTQQQGWSEEEPLV